MKEDASPGVWLLLDIPTALLSQRQQQLAFDSQEPKLFKFRHSGNIHVRPNSLLARPRRTKS
jgi:hypothetical protein